MLKTKNKIVPVGSHTLNSVEFDTYRNALVESFTDNSHGVYKEKLTQGLYWTSLDKDVANQFWRREKWFFGVKVSDILRFVDHNITEVDVSISTVGFIKPNKNK